MKHFNQLSINNISIWIKGIGRWNTVTHSDTHCNTMRTHCNTFKHIQTHCNTFKHIKHIQTHSNTFKHINHIEHSNTFKHIQAHSNTFKHIQTHSNTHPDSGISPVACRRILRAPSIPRDWQRSRRCRNVRISMVLHFPFSAPLAASLSGCALLLWCCLIIFWKVWTRRTWIPTRMAQSQLYSEQRGRVTCK